MFKNILTAGITAAIVAVLAVVLVGGNHQSSQVGATTGNSTNYTTLGVKTLYVGTGCDDSNTTCTGLSIDKNGTVLTNAAASSTIQVGGASLAGCVIVGDSSDGASPVYITASGSTVTASTTKPAACRTAQ